MKNILLVLIIWNMYQFDILIIQKNLHDWFLLLLNFVWVVRFEIKDR